jgi:hypothetical protein
MRQEELGNLIKIIHLIGSRTRDLQVCNIAPNHYATAYPEQGFNFQPKQDISFCTVTRQVQPAAS